MAEKHSFTAAGAQLGLSTAQVSRQVQRLEQRLNSKLFYRSTRHVSLTEAGQLYYQHCRRALDHLQDAENSLGQWQQGPQGHIKLTAPVTYGETLIAPQLSDFALQHERLSISLELTNQQVDLVAQGVDLAIRLGKLEDSSLRARRLADRTQYVCASPDYLRRRGSPHTLAELRQHNCLLGTLPYWRFQEGRESRLLKVEGRFRVNSGKALLDAALKGMGIVQLPDYYVEEPIRQRQLIPLLSQYQAHDEAVWAVFPQREFLPLKVSVLVDYLAEALAGGKSVGAG